MKEFMKKLVDESIEACLPDTAVKKAIKYLPEVHGKIIVIAIGKAAYRMARSFKETGLRFDKGIIITKKGHLKSGIEGFTCFEASHPVSDETSIRAAQCALEAVKNLTKNDAVVMLISGGASSLFELPSVELSVIQDINKQLLSKGADIIEINTIRKRLSNVKGGKFALACAPAHVYNIILSDVLGNRGDMIASGPTYPDFSTSKEAMDIVKKYDLKLSDDVLDLLKTETVRKLDNITTEISGSVDELCATAMKILMEAGYKTEILTTSLCCQAREAGRFIGSIGRTFSKTEERRAFIFGGETVVHVKGKGKGGRNQEIAFAGAKEIAGLSNVCLISFSSDGTDGPTDAAGAYSDGETLVRLEEEGFSFAEVLDNNDTYTALKAIDRLIITGPTGTNVNDVSILMIN